MIFRHLNKTAPPHVSSLNTNTKTVVAKDSIFSAVFLRLYKFKKSFINADIKISGTVHTLKNPPLTTIIFLYQSSDLLFRRCCAYQYILPYLRGMSNTQLTVQLSL